MSERLFTIPFRPHFSVPLHNKLIQEKISELDYDSPECFVYHEDNRSGLLSSVFDVVGTVKIINCSESKYSAEVLFFDTDIAKTYVHMLNLENGEVLPQKIHLKWSIIADFKIIENKTPKLFWFGRKDYVSKIVDIQHFYLSLEK